jgi:serine/threonine protein kinase
VKAWQGRGSYGAVYRAERVGWRRSEPGALKVSLQLWNWRMEREVELLSRLNHPGIPRLLDRGGSQPPGSGEYPYFVMEWVEGPRLYAWVEKEAPSSRQVCRVVARLARALEAVHAAGAVHRDVKGDNVLIRVSDRLPVLTDFGSCHFAGAQRLTRQSLPPVTPEYLSPQALLFYLRSVHQPEGYYPPSPADDLYALGVTAYRLVMGRYPERIDARQDEQGTWQARSPEVRPQLESNPRVEPALREVIVRLLSAEPEERGKAAQAAEALEAAAGGEERPERAEPQGRAWDWKPWLALAAVGACVVLLWHWQPVSPPSGRMTGKRAQGSDSRAPDAGSAAVGNTEPTPPGASTAPAAEKKPLAQEPLPEPRPGQLRPDKRGRCPGRKQVAINGGCWLDVSSPVMDAQTCAEGGYVLYQGKCLGPANEPPKKPQPTSSQPEER